jgi:PBP1b-binding outer membrane lipoprotein LpoB
MKKTIFATAIFSALFLTQVANAQKENAAPKKEAAKTEKKDVKATPKAQPAETKATDKKNVKATPKAQPGDAKKADAAKPEGKKATAKPAAEKK